MPAELENIVEARQKLESQLQENQGVQRVDTPKVQYSMTRILTARPGIRLPRRRCQHLQARRARVVEAG